MNQTNSTVTGERPSIFESPRRSGAPAAYAVLGNAAQSVLFKSSRHRGTESYPCATQSTARSAIMSTVA